MNTSSCTGKLNYLPYLGGAESCRDVSDQLDVQSDKYTNFYDIAAVYLSSRKKPAAWCR